jgi:hypothetical protein
VKAFLVIEFINRGDTMKSSLFKRSLILPWMLSLAAILMLVAGCSSDGRTYAFNGERIYFTGANEQGQKIGRTGGGFLFFSAPACAKCHGDAGQGDEGKKIPEITWEHLTSVESHSHDDGTTDALDHPIYSEDSVKKAITEGVKPDGDAMNSGMPRWHFESIDLNDLLVFLKTL